MRVIFILIILFVNTVNAAEFAITMDDPNTFSKPLFSSEERNQKILSQLNFLNTKAALFVSGVRVNSDEGVNLLKNWDREEIGRAHV